MSPKELVGVGSDLDRFKLDASSVIAGIDPVPSSDPGIGICESE